MNIRGTLSICQLALNLKAKLVVAGSSAEYGKSGLRYDQIPVDAPLEPTSPYAVSKAVGGNLMLGFARTMKLTTAYVRIFNAYGKGQHESNLWPSLMRAAESGDDFYMTRGEQVRDFIKVEEVAHELVSSVTNWKLIPGRPLVSNCGSGNAQSIREFCEKFWSLHSNGGSLHIGALEYRENEVMRFVPKLESKYL